METQLQPNLKPQTIGEILDTTFRQYKTEFSFWFLILVYVFLPFLIVNAALAYGTTTNVNMYLSMLAQSATSHNNQDQALLGTMVGQVVWIYLLALLDALIVRPFMLGAVVHYVTEKTLYGRRVSVGKALLYSVRRLIAVILTNIFRYIILIVCFAVVGGVLAGIVGIMAIAHAPTWIDWLLGIVFGISFVGFTIWIAVKFAFVTPVAVEEKRILFGPIARSWVLTRQNFWRIFGFFILMTLIVLALQSGIAALVGLLMQHQPLLSTVISTVLAFFVTPISLFGMANLYVDLRIRTDGLDLASSLPIESETSPLT
jgi:hypothetical protein